MTDLFENKNVRCETLTARSTSIICRHILFFFVKKKVWDVDGKEYFDYLSAYSAVNQGHCHPKVCVCVCACVCLCACVCIKKIFKKKQIVEAIMNQPQDKSTCVCSKNV